MRPEDAQTPDDLRALGYSDDAVAYFRRCWDIIKSPDLPDLHPPEVLQRWRDVCTKLTLVGPMPMAFEIFRVARQFADQHRYHALQITIWTHDRTTKKPIRVAQSWSLPVRVCPTEAEVIAAIRPCALFMWTHEFNELFRYGEDRPFDPHEDTSWDGKYPLLWHAFSKFYLTGTTGRSDTLSGRGDVHQGHDD